MRDSYEESFTPEERLDRITEILTEGVIRLSYQEEQKEVLDNTEAETVKKINSTEEYLDTKDIMKVLKVSRTTLWRLRRGNKIPYYKIGESTLIRYKFSDLLR